MGSTFIKTTLSGEDLIAFENVDHNFFRNSKNLDNIRDNYLLDESAKEVLNDMYSNAARSNEDFRRSIEQAQKDSRKIIEDKKSMNPLNQKTPKEFVNECREESKSKTLNTAQKKQVNDVLKKNGVDPQKVDDSSKYVFSKIIEKDMELQKKIQFEQLGYREFKRFIGANYMLGSSLRELGVVTGNEKLAKIGSMAENFMGSSAKILTAMEGMGINLASQLGNLGFALGGVTNAISAAIPGLNLAVGFISLFGMFRGKKKKGGDNGLKAIFEGIQAIYNEVRELRKDLHEFRIETFEKLLQIAEYMANDFKLPVMRQLDAIQSDLHFFSGLIIKEIRDQDLNRLLEAIKGVEENLALGDIPRAENDLAIVSKFLSVTPTSSTFNGKAFLPENSQSSDFYRQANLVLSHELVNINTHMGFLYAVYMREKNQMQSSSFNNDELSSSLPNLRIYAYALQRYLEFVQNPKLKHRTNPAILNELKKPFAAIEKFIGLVKDDKSFIDYVKNKFQETLVKLEPIVNQQLAIFDLAKANSMTVAGAFHDSGNKVIFDQFVSQLEYYKNLLFIFSSLIGDYQTLLANQHIYQIGNVINNHPLFKPTDIEGPEWTPVTYGKPEYYETIQTGKFKQDGIEKIYFSIRDENGIDLRIYNPNDNSWFKVERNPSWADAAGFDKCCYYKTLRVAVLGENQIYFVIREKNGISLFCYYLSSNTWKQLRSIDVFSGTDGFTDKLNFNHEENVLHMTVMGQSLMVTVRAGDRYYTIFFDPSKNSWNLDSKLPVFTSKPNQGWGRRECYSTYTLKGYDVEKGKKAVFLARYVNGVPVLWFHNCGTSVTPSHGDLRDNNFHLASHYLPTKVEVMDVNGKDYLFMTARTEAGLKVYRSDLSSVVERVKSIYPKELLELFDSETRDINSDFSDQQGFGEKNHAHAASIRTQVVQMNGKNKLLVMGQSSAEFLIYMVDPTTLKWQKIFSNNIFESFDDVVANSLRTEVITLKDGSQELIISAMQPSGLKLYRYPLSAKPLINSLALSNALLTDGQNSLVSASATTPIEDEVKQLGDSIDQAIKTIGGEQQSSWFQNPLITIPIATTVGIASSRCIPGVRGSVTIPIGIAVGIAGLYFIPGARAREIPAETTNDAEFTAAPNVVPASYQSSLPEQLTLLQWALPYISSWMPWNKPQGLSREAAAELKQDLKLLPELISRLDRLKQNIVGQSGLFTEQLDRLSLKIKTIKKDIRKVLKNNEVSQSHWNEIKSKQSDIQDELNNFEAKQEQLMDWAKESEQLLKEGKRLAVSYEPVRDRLTRRVESLAQLPRNNSGMTKELFNFGSFAQQQQFWASAGTTLVNSTKLIDEVDVPLGLGK